jgi:hypothetical protein
MSGLVINVFAERGPLLAALRSGEALPGVIRRMALASFLCAWAYGGVLGVQMGGWQVVASPVKLPLIMLGTSAICVSALYVLLALAGGRLRWLQVAGLALCSVAASSVVMAALLPVAAFWTFSFQGNETAITLLHTAAFMTAGALGSRFGLEMAGGLFPQARMVRVMLVWMWIYGLVAQQMAWLFRPHFHATTMFMRPLGTGGSALESLFRLLLNHLRG